MGGVRLTRRAVALAIVFLGAILIAAGVWLLAGLGWALVALGAMTIGEALLMDTGRPATTNPGETRPPFASRPR